MMPRRFLFLVIVLQAVAMAHMEQTTRQAHYHIEHSSFQFVGETGHSPQLHTFVANILEVHGNSTLESSGSGYGFGGSESHWQHPRLICGHYLFGDESFMAEIVKPKASVKDDQSTSENISKILEIEI